MTGYCPECQDWYMVKAADPTKEPTGLTGPQGPTEAPVGFRSWANDNWINNIKRRDSSATMIGMKIGTNVCSGIVAFLVTVYYLY